MHGCGNDYVFVDTIGGPPIPESVDLHRLAARLSDRHFGVGGDGLIIISRSPAGRLGMRMFNADGSEGEMCGNGMRCLAAYVYEQGYVSETRFEVDTLAGTIIPEISPTPEWSAAAGPAPAGAAAGALDVAGGAARAPGRTRRVASVTVDQGSPREIRPGIELTVPAGPAAGAYHGTFVSMGNPHFVVIVPDISAVDLSAAGPALEAHPYFPSRANIEFAQVLGPRRLRMRVWERGSGVTLASGTGASASLVAAALAGLCARKATVLVDGGELEVDWTPEGPVRVTGPTAEVFRTTYRLEERS